MRSSYKLYELLHNSTWFMFEKGAYGDILQYTQIALAVLNDIDLAQSLEAALILNTIGNYHLETRDFSKALENTTQVLAIREKILPPDDPIVSNTLHNLAYVYGGLRDYEKANQECDRALNIREKLPETEKNAWFKRRSLPVNYTTKCRCLFLIRDLEGAEIFGRKAVQACSEAFQPKHYLTTQAYCSLAEVLYDRGKLKEALENHTIALTYRMEVLGEHNRTAASHYKLGLIYKSIDLQISRRLFSHSADIYRKTRLDDGPCARALYHLSLVCAQIGDVKAADEARREARQLLEKVTGRESREIEEGPEAYDQVVGFLEI